MLVKDDWSRKSVRRKKSVSRHEEAVALVRWLNERLLKIKNKLLRRFYIKETSKDEILEEEGSKMLSNRIFYRRQQRRDGEKELLEHEKNLKEKKRLLKQKSILKS